MNTELSKEDTLKMIGMFFDIVKRIQVESKTNASIVVGSGLYSNIIDSLDFYSEKIKPFLKK
jgi:hypothetical protein